MGVTQLNSHSKEDQKKRIKMRLSLKLLILFVIFVACFEMSNSKRGGGGRGGGSRGSSSSRGGSRWGGSSRSHSSSNPSFGSKKSKRQKAISTLKKAAVVGAVAYGAYQVGKFGWTINSGWFGGEKPIGECSCDDGFEWDDDDLECERQWGRYFGMGIIGFIIFILVLACCCCGICCFAVKKF